MVSGVHILKEVCFMTTSFPASHFFHNSVIISRAHFKKSTCQRNCVYFATLFKTIHYNKWSVVDSRKSWRECLFQENHRSPALLNVSIYFTELVTMIFFFEKYCVKCTKALSYIYDYSYELFQGLCTMCLEMMATKTLNLV